MDPNHDLFTPVLHKHFLCFLLPFFFFFLKVQSKIGVCIIHRCTLNTGKYSKMTLMPGLIFNNTLKTMQVPHIGLLQQKKEIWKGLDS